MNIHRTPPEEDRPGLVTCRVCGRSWETDPAQDALLAELFDHESTHRGDGTG
jgi:hypothetical protein